MRPYRSTQLVLDVFVQIIEIAHQDTDFGIFFFTPDGKYVEWTGTYLYSDIPFEVDDPVVKIGG